MLKDVLAARLRVLMAERDDLDTQARVAQRAGVSQSTVGRILSREVHTSLDVLEALAAAFRVHPLSLVSDPRDMTQASAAAVDYSERLLLEAWRRLAPQQQHAVMGYIEVATARSVLAGTKPATTAESAAVETVSEVPAGAKAAVRRAASRPPGSDFEQALDDDQKHSGEKEQQRAARRRRR